jgi:TonB-dependent starch-binding outer membrane protein SusC
MKTVISSIKLIILCVSVLLTFGFAAFSAEIISAAPKKGTVNGKVITEDAKPLQAASIVIHGTTVGTSSDAEGNFMLKNVPADAEIQISYVGFKSLQVKPDFNQPLNIRIGI